MLDQEADAVCPEFVAPQASSPTEQKIRPRADRRVKLGTRRSISEYRIPEIDRLSEPTEWIGLELVERERTPRSAIQVGFQLHLADLSLSNTKQYLEKLDVK
jgi:hypothetical protein